MYPRARGVELCVATGQTRPNSATSNWWFLVEDREFHRDLSVVLTLLGICIFKAMTRPVVPFCAALLTCELSFFGTYIKDSKSVKEQGHSFALWTRHELRLPKSENQPHALDTSIFASCLVGSPTNRDVLRCPHNCHNLSIQICRFRPRDVSGTDVPIGIHIGTSKNWGSFQVPPPFFECVTYPAW